MSAMGGKRTLPRKSPEQASVYLSTAHVPNKGIADRLAMLLGCWTVGVAAFGYEDGVREAIRAHQAACGKKIGDVQRPSIDD